MTESRSVFGVTSHWMIKWRDILANRVTQSVKNLKKCKWATFGVPGIGLELACKESSCGEIYIIKRTQSAGAHAH